MRTILTSTLVAARAALAAPTDATAQHHGHHGGFGHGRYGHGGFYGGFGVGYAPAVRYAPACYAPAYPAYPSSGASVYADPHCHW